MEVAVKRPSGQRWVAGGVVLAAVLMVVAALVSGPLGIGARWLGGLGVLLAVVVIAIALNSLYGLVMMLAGVDPDARLIASSLVPGAAEQQLLTRWLVRTRWARNVGGWAGVAWWMFGTSGQGDLMLYGVGGLSLGSMAAQLHHVRTQPGPRTASLDDRSIASFVVSKRLSRMAAVVVGAALLVGLGIAASVWRSAAFGAGAAGIIGLTYLVQWRVARRPRPALSVDIERADNLARALAIDRGLAQPSVYFGLALLAHGFVLLRDPLGGVSIAVSVVLWMLAMGLWLENRRLGLDWLIPRSSTPVAS